MLILSFIMSSSIQHVNAQDQIIPNVFQSPTGLTVNLVAPSKIALSWTAPSIPASALLTGYKIERSIDSGNTWSVIVANTDNASTRYVDTGLASGTTYTYHVFAIYHVKISSPSNDASATTSSIRISAQFWNCCYGFFKMEGAISNPVPESNDQVHVQFYAPNGQLVLDNTHTLCSSCAYFEDSIGISRDQGKGNYTIIATYDNELIAKEQVPSWINNNSISFNAGEGSDGSVGIGGRAFTGIAGEQDLVTILDPNNSTTATYPMGTGLQGQISLMISATNAAQAFPVSGNYTIILTYPTGDMAGKTMLTYTR